MLITCKEPIVKTRKESLSSSSLFANASDFCFSRLLLLTLLFLQMFLDSQTSTEFLSRDLPVHFYSLY